MSKKMDGYSASVVEYNAKGNDTCCKSYPISSNILCYQLKLSTHQNSKEYDHYYVSMDADNATVMLLQQSRDHQSGIQSYK